jgi:hypothetical protein
MQEKQNMKSSDWMILPIFRNAWPEDVYMNAKKCGISVEDIVLNERAAGKKIEQGRTILKAIPFDMLDLIIDVEQSDENANMTFVMFGDDEGTAIMVMWPIKKFIKELDRFMQGNPKYRNIAETIQTVHFHPSPYPPAPNSEEEDDE